MKSKLKQNWSYFFVALFIIVTVLYVAFYGKSVYVPVHDNLDSNIAWLKMLKDHHLFWAQNAKVPFLGGTDRNYLCSEWKAYHWLFMLMPVFEAYVAGFLLKIVISVGSCVFLGKIILKEEYCQYHNLVALCGFLYGILPTFPTSGFSFASIPFLFGILWCLEEQSDWRWYICLCLYPVFSEFSLFGFFICIYILMFFVCRWIVKKKANANMLLALAALAVGYAATEYRLFYMMLFSEVSSIRTSFITSYADIKNVCGAIRMAFRYGHYHSQALHQYFVFPFCICYFIYLNLSYVWKKEPVNILKDKFNWLITWIFCNACVYGFDKYEPFRKMVERLVPPLAGFSFARTLWFNPFLWYLSFAVILFRIAQKKHIRASFFLCGCAIAVIFIYPSMYNHISLNIRSRTAANSGKQTDNFTYEQFYQEELFQKVKKAIDYNGEYAVAYGMHPAVLEYNGIATLDGYISNYSQEYKERFRTLIAPELEKDPTNRNYFDHWGGRAYMFSATVSYGYAPEPQPDAAELNIDIAVFEELKGKYVFSRVEIVNADQLGLQLREKFEDKTFPYSYIVYVYEK